MWKDEKKIKWGTEKHAEKDRCTKVCKPVSLQTFGNKTFPNYMIVSLVNSKIMEGVINLITKIRN